MSGLKVAVIGAGWGGLAAAVAAVQDGHQVTLFEAARQWGGRARAVEASLPDGRRIALDNGQHILIGAYTNTLDLMRTVGIEPQNVLLRLPLCMQFPNGQGMRLPDWPMPLDVIAGVLCAPGWTLSDKYALIRHSARWQAAGFQCPPALSVALLCQHMSPRVMQSLIEPLCVSALNTPADRASAQVFLRVLKDALLGGKGSSNLLLPTCDLSGVLPNAAAMWLERQGAKLRLGHRVQELAQAHAASTAWQVDGEAFDAVVCATSASAASPLLAQAAGRHDSVQAWLSTSEQLQFEAIATTYVQTQGARLPRPMLALHSDAESPAQFVFDRGQLGGPAGLLAFVVSASGTQRSVLQEQVLQQARNQLTPWLKATPLQALQTIVEKRATFACTPGLQRPAPTIAPGLLACGDYIDGPYPATLEGAIRSGRAASRAISGMGPRR